MSERANPEVRYLQRTGLQSLIDVLIAEEFEVIGPTIDQEAIVFRPIRDASELPRGWTDQQQPATYRLQQPGHDRFFHFNAGPDSWKKFLFPPRQQIGTAKLNDTGWHFETSKEPVPKYAFLGVRACDLAAITIQDRVFAEGDYVDPTYKQRRDAALIIAVNCSTAAPTCFCTSMNTGPRCQSGFDLSLTELDDGFTIEIGSARGESIVAKVPTASATTDHRTAALEETEQARALITKQLETAGIYDLLMDNLDHPNWDAVAERCLSCANCTMVCPTCFCSTVEEVSDLQNEDVSRMRNWDSCFNFDLSYTAGGTVRNTTRSRYRQWLTHKLATWQDQFDVSGCTGCGRCITWCPVGIDLTVEVARLEQQSD
jgi:sulfhydrogenase subunit beta (sulfur reductase)